MIFPSPSFPIVMNRERASPLSLPPLLVPTHPSRLHPKRERSRHEIIVLHLLHRFPRLIYTYIHNILRVYARAHTHTQIRRGIERDEEEREGERGTGTIDACMSYRRGPNCLPTCDVEPRAEDLFLRGWDGEGGWRGWDSVETRITMRRASMDPRASGRGFEEECARCSIVLSSSR